MRHARKLHLVGDLGITGEVLVTTQAKYVIASETCKEATSSGRLGYYGRGSSFAQ